MIRPNPLTRRRLLGGLAAGGAALALPMRGNAQGHLAHIAVIGGGFGGASAARYLKLRAPDLRVSLIEPALRYYTCPFSNLYLGGLRDWESLGHGYDGLRAMGIELIPASAKAIDPLARKVTLSGGQALNWDRLVVAPGIDLRWNALDRYDPAAAEHAPHAWKAGAQTQLLRRQLEAMPDGGTFVMSIPENPYRCPPGPYERASLIAHYFKTHKPRAKILLLDGKDTFSKQALFQQGWQALYGEMIEWVGLSDDGQVTRVDAKALTVETAFGTRHKADVLNVIPPQKAAKIADQAGLSDTSGWVPVDGASFTSLQVPGVYVVGDATLAAPMPKSGFVANTQAKVVVSAILADLAGQPAPAAVFANTCYSLIGPDYGISVAGIYRNQGAKIIEQPDSGGVSPLDASADFRAAEARYGASWYKAMVADIWGA